MSPIAHHLQLRLRTGGIIATTPERMRIVSRAVFHQARDHELLAFALSDTHLHLLLLCLLSECGVLAQAIEAGLKQRLKLHVGFEPFNPTAVHDTWQLYRVFRYVITQYQRHELDWTFVHEGSNLPDLLGLRLVGRRTLDPLRRSLPRMQRSTLVKWLDVDSLSPADGPSDALLDATCSAACVPTLAGKAPEVVEARRALVEVAGQQLSSSRLAELLEIDPRSVRRLRDQPANPALVQAIRLQLGLRAQRDRRGRA